MRILMIEDDESIATGVIQALKRKSYLVEWIADGRQGLSAALDNPFDLVILDLGLPGLDGLDVLGQLRAKQNQTPVIVVSARDSIAHRIEGLNAGADDYLIKPFDQEELFARIHAIERRMGGASSNLLKLGDLVMDLSAQQVWWQGQEVTLQRRELTLLKKLMENPRQVFSREQLEESLYGWSSEVGSNTVDVFVHNIRKKIYTGVIKTLRGIGYRIDPELLTPPQS